MLSWSNPATLCGPCGRAVHERRDTLTLPADFYDRPDVAAALERHDFGRLFQAVRAELELTQDALGLLIGIAQSRICKVETGNALLRDIGTVARLARLLAIPPKLLGFVPGPPGSIDGSDSDRAVSWLERRDFLTTVSALALGAGAAAPVHDQLTGLVPAIEIDPPRRVGLTDVERIEATSRAFRDWDDRWGGGLCRAAVVAQLRWVVATGRQAVCASTEVHDRLLAATAELADVAAYASYDVERHDEARRLWMVGLGAAREANRADLVGSILRRMAYQARHLRRPEEAVHLVRLAYASTADPALEMPELTLASIAACEGLAHAAAGNVRACERAFGRAEEHLDNTRDESVPPWLEHFDRTELTELRGLAYHALAERLPAAARRAEPLLAEVVAARGPDRARSKTISLIALSATYFQRGDGIEEGVRLGYQALVDAGTLNSPRTMSRLAGLDPVAAAYHDRADVAEFRDRLALTLTGSG